ncbi:MAG TPA: hypothetical protein VK177_07415 [Flavobacteriales bacterium]|nr:hypothetical protein [Flavobacteriales bacterium]
MKFFRFLILLIPGVCFGQIPPVEWSKCYGTLQNDHFRAVASTLDSGFIAVGDSDTSLSMDVLVVKTDANGNQEWLQVLGDVSSAPVYPNLELAYGVISTYDSCYVIVGEQKLRDSTLTILPSNVWIAKLDANGNTLWIKSYGGSSGEYATCVIESKYGGYYIGGRTESVDGDINNPSFPGQFWLIKIDVNGNMEWNKKLGGTGFDDGLRSILENQDGTLMLLGASTSSDFDISANYGESDYVLLKVDSTGTVLWNKHYGGSQTDYPNKLIASGDGGFVLAGITVSNDFDVAGGTHLGTQDFFVVKVDSIGTIAWKKVYGGNWNEDLPHVDKTNDGGFVIAGSTSSTDIISNKGHTDFWIIKTNNTGNIQWHNNYGGSDGDDLFSLISTIDGGFLMVGSTASGTMSYTDGDVVGNNYYGGYGGWMIKLKNTIGVADYMLNEIYLSLFPNPVSDRINIQLSEFTSGLTFGLFNALGESVFSIPIDRSLTSLSMENIPAGFYSWCIYSNSDMQLATGRIVVSH